MPGDSGDVKRKSPLIINRDSKISHSLSRSMKHGAKDFIVVMNGLVGWKN